MTRPPRSIRTDTVAFALLRETLAQIMMLVDRSEVDLVDLGKAYQSFARGMLDVATEAGRRSIRYEAASRALDLKTPKSALQAFLSP